MPIDSQDVSLEQLFDRFHSESDLEALDIIRDAWASYFNYWRNNIQPQIDEALRLYHGYLEPKTWEGTSKPRSQLPIQLAFDQIESIHSFIEASIFGGPGPFFEVRYEDPAANPAGADIARQVRDYFYWVLQQPTLESFSPMWTEFSRAIKQALLFGRGYIYLDWDKARDIPTIRWIDSRNIFVDPTLSDVSIDRARAVITVEVMTVDQLDALRGQNPRLRIPPRDFLITLANPGLAIPAQLKQSEAAVKGVQNPFPTHLLDEGSNQLVIINYVSRTRQISTINNQVVIYNDENPYRFIPFCSVPCFIEPGSFYCAGIPRVIRSLQLYIQALINARLDLLALALNPPRKKRHGGSVFSQSLNRWAPGETFTVKELDDLEVVLPDIPVKDIWPEVAYFESLAERRTGANSLGVAGIPARTSANRSATGIMAQVQGAGLRVGQFIRNAENYLIIPALYKMHMMIRARMEAGYLSPESMVAAENEMGEVYSIPLSVLEAPVSFTITASSKMLGRDRLLQLLPFVIQYMMNPALLQELVRTGRTVDFDNLLAMLEDAVGTRGLYNLVRPLTPQEMAMIRQQQALDPEIIAKLQAEQMKADVRREAARLKAATELAKLEAEQEANE